ncbi:uncharacterized protein LY89DRAFT_719327 [Mollisia scopiformis]|uniref:Chromatin remodeling factor mit1 n=1 Tax=Mollisia scopiformis TaxID=149040 RepID=A0A194X699_MOLSC|nr:uncharacterized protein LY89DRAFT_719327 [Mollisia scopiformis]KUJ15594.1 hypothetical protein LY89DRAFT_719327 [Mollisia scopiformis]
MTSSRHVSDSESDSSSESQADNIHTPVPDEESGVPGPSSFLSHRFRKSPPKPQSERHGSAVAVLLSPPKNPWEYQPFKGHTTVDSILEVFEGTNGEHRYKIEYEDGNQEEVSEHKLLKLRNGQNALDFYNTNKVEISETNKSLTEGPTMNSNGVGKRTRVQTSNTGYVDSSNMEFNSDEDELYAGQTDVKRRRVDKESGNQSTRSSTRQSSRIREGGVANPKFYEEESSDTDDAPSAKRGPQLNRGTSLGPRRSTRTTRSTDTHSRQSTLKYAYETGPSYEDEDADELANGEQDESDSDVGFMPLKQQRRTGHIKGRSLSKGKRGRPRKHSSSSASPERPQPSRRSGRDRAIKSMKERDVDEEMYADDTPLNNDPKVISVREVFQPISSKSPFGFLHRQTCDVCNGVGSKSNKGNSPLVYCQGCSTTIHKVCLGYRSGREHLVTKVGHENFILQCRRCIGTAAKKDELAPILGACQSCKQDGLSCGAFTSRKTAKQEEKLREQNNGEDPITNVPENLLNNPENVLFRCTSCQQAFHFEHLPPLDKKSKTSSDVEELHKDRFHEYKVQWRCKDCLDTSAKVQTLVAWRPVDQLSYVNGQEADEFREDEKEYLIKWEAQSYFKCSWMPGGWVWGTTAAVMRKAFFKRDEGANNLPKWTEEEAIPEDFLCVEIVLDVDYDDDFEPQSEVADKAAIQMVDQVYVKFKGLSYDEVVWEDPPDPDDGERWTHFVAAYNEYVAGKYFKQPSAGTMKERTDHFRSMDFDELKKQPSALSGGDMMPYQLQGLNWLLYNFHQMKNVILADEMGLGKTIQIISFIAALVEENPRCWPFLVVTPNSTCPNWRREIKKWAPNLRVVAFYGGKKARDMAMEYELYPGGCSDLRAHVVVTSYEGPVDDSSKSFFRRIKWAGMIVDEGQRLKNDGNLLYGALKALKVPFQVLLTGTPLQNNKRELFNLLQFLDTSINATELDEEYAELTRENLPGLHELIRPFFLRRTKREVLKFLPSISQVILPLTMSVLQKRLYKSILEKNGQLIKSILGHDTHSLKATERGNLNNILMQLRKCLCHPFVYSAAVEERNLPKDALHRNLIDASAKLQLLEMMLPKLKARGHRVLLFSQFLNQLDIIEDFLNGLGFRFQRLDGNIPALEKQKRIDAFNAPNSPDFAFILSTRAGGVGINLATADTVIIMDPDFNPHQDIQALSRAHRIGQTKPVLCFQLMTKDSAEEKIVQIGRQKMSLDHALIESMKEDDDTHVDLESILKHGAEALFNDDDRNDVHYNSASVDQLLDRAQAQTTVTDLEKTAESHFKFARVWASDKGDLTENIEINEHQSAAPNSDFWDKILRKREAKAAAEAARNMQTFGRGKRARQTIDYQKSNLDLDDDMPDSSPLKQPSKRKPADSASDLDFPDADDSDGDDDSDIEPVDARELHSGTPSKFGSSRKDDHDGYDNVQQSKNENIPSRSTGSSPPGRLQPTAARFGSPIQEKLLSTSRSGHSTSQHSSRPELSSTSHNRSHIKPSSNLPLHEYKDGNLQKHYSDRPIPSSTPTFCQSCRSTHPIGPCPLQDLCGKCGLAHLKISRTCPKYSSEVRLRLLLDNTRSLAAQAGIDDLRAVLRLELSKRTQRRKI